jgi:spoIIIJ-associated protein
MKGQEFRGRTADEAIAAGLEALGVSREEVQIEVLDTGARGFLGLGAKEARVLITQAPTAAEVAEVWLREVVAATGVDASLEVVVEQGVLQARLEGSELGSLIGGRGRTLDALQYLLSLAVGKRTRGQRQVFLDIGGYRRRREETLSRIARQAADQVGRTGKSVTLEPMPPAERRIIHLALQEMKDLSTQSEGEEPYRRVVISVRQRGAPTG